MLKYGAYIFLFTVTQIAWGEVIENAQLDGFQDDLYKNVYTGKAKKLKQKNGYPGSSGFGKCQEYSNKDWDELTNESDKYAFTDEAFQVKWRDIITSFWRDGDGVRDAFRDIQKSYEAVQAKMATTTQGDNHIEELKNLKSAFKSEATDVKNILEELNRIALSEFNDVRLCAGLISTMSDIDSSDYKNSDIVESTQGREKKSVLDRIRCRSSGIETLDYKPCKSLITAYDTAIIAFGGLEAIQQVQISNAQGKAQEEYMENRGEASAALEAQKAGIDKQKGVAGQQMAFHGLKLGTLATLYSQMPSKEDVETKCTKYKSKFQGAEAAGNGYILIKKRLQVYNDKLAKATGDALGADSSFKAELDDASDADNEPTPQNVTEICYSIAFASRFDIIINEDGKDGAKFAMVESGMDLAKMGMISKMLGDQSKRVGNAISELNDFPGEDPTFVDETIEINPCEANPNSFECLGINPITQQGFSGMDINFGAGNAANVGTQFEDNNDESEIVANNESSELVPLGISAIPLGINKGSGFESSPPGAASIEAANAAAGGGLGGGGAAGGGGGGASGARGGGKAAARRPSSKNLQYKGGGNKVRYASNSSKKSSKSGSRKNPFADLLKKGKLRKKGSDLTFRGLASKSGKSIFQIISGGYNKMQSKNRLLKYQVRK
jgi:hypothetical protein